MPDHDALFARLAAALCPGGRISAQCGGAGNVATVHASALEAAADAGLAGRFDGWPAWTGGCLRRSLDLVTSEAPLRLMTAQELFEYSHEPYRHELVDGMLLEMEPPGAEHGYVAMRIGGPLLAHVTQHRLGVVFLSEVGFHLRSDPDTVRGPDVSFVSQQRVEEIGIPRGYWPGPPDLAVEVVSPNDRRSKVEGKALDWLDSGTRAVVVLDPPLRTATRYLARDDIRAVTADESLDLDDIVPGWAPLVRDFFV